MCLSLVRVLLRLQCLCGGSECWRSVRPAGWCSHGNGDHQGGGKSTCVHQWGTGRNIDRSVGYLHLCFQNVLLRILKRMQLWDVRCLGKKKNQYAEFLPKAKLKEVEFKLTGSDAYAARFGQTIADLGDLDDDGYPGANHSCTAWGHKQWNKLLLLLLPYLDNTHAAYLPFLLLLEVSLCFYSWYQSLKDYCLSDKNTIASNNVSDLRTSI